MIKWLDNRPGIHATFRLLFLVGILGLFYLQGLGQFYSKLYFDNHPSMLFGSIDNRGNTMYVTGVTTAIAPPYSEKALFGKLSADGNIAFINSIIDSNQYSYDIFLNSLKRTSDGNYIATGYLYDTAYKAFMIKIDTNSNVLLWHQYTHIQTQLFQGQDVIEVPDSGYLIAINACFTNGNSEVVIIRTDTLGEIVNEKTYGAGSLEFPWCIRSMNNNHFMVGAVSFKQGAQTPWWAKTWLIEVDSMGEMVRQWLDSDATNLFPNGMEQTVDSGWIIARQHMNYDVDDYQAFQGSVLKLDKSFHKEWEIDTGGSAVYAGMYDVEILDDGSYICAGANPINLSQDSAHIYGWLMKVSTTGQIVWERTYLAIGNSNSESYLYDVDVLPNGDLLACGKNESGLTTPSQQAWILRTDSNGCVMDNCWLDVKEIGSGPIRIDLKVYPNPAEDLLNVSFAANEKVNQLAISNMRGEEVLKQRVNSGESSLEINIKNLPNGVYFLQLKGQEGINGVGKFNIIK